MITKKFYETTGQKINEYGEVVNFYEKNREGRFQTKNDLKKISNEINLELEKGQTENNLYRLSLLQKRISKFI